MVRSQDSSRVWLQLGIDFQGFSPYLETYQGRHCQRNLCANLSLLREKKQEAMEGAPMMV